MTVRNLGTLLAALDQIARGLQGMPYVKGRPPSSIVKNAIRAIQALRLENDGLRDQLREYEEEA